MKKLTLISASFSIIASLTSSQVKGANDLKDQIIPTSHSFFKHQTNIIEQNPTKDTTALSEIKALLNIPELLWITCDFLDNKTLYDARGTSKIFDHYYKNIRGVHLKIDGDKIKDFLITTKDGDYPFVRLLTLTGNWEDAGEKGIFNHFFRILNEQSTRIQAIDMEEMSLAERDSVFLATHMPRELHTLSANQKTLDRMSTFLPRNLSKLKIKNFKSKEKVRVLSNKGNFLKSLPEKLSTLEFNFIQSVDFSFKSQEIFKTFPSSLTTVFFINYTNFPFPDSLIEFIKNIPEFLKCFILKRHGIKLDNFQYKNDQQLVPFMSNLPDSSNLDIEGLNFLIGPNFLKMLEGEEVSQDYIQNFTEEDLNNLIMLLEDQRSLEKNNKLRAMKKVQSEYLVEIAKKYHEISSEDKKRRLHILGIAIDIYKIALGKGEAVREDIGNLYHEAAKVVSEMEDGYISFADISGPSSLRKRDECLQESMKYGNKKAQYELGVLYRKGQHYQYNNSSCPDLDQALQCFFPLAKEGDPKAQHNVGWIYHKKNMKAEAIKWYELAVKQGQKESIHNLKLLTQ